MKAWMIDPSWERDWDYDDRDVIVHAESYGSAKAHLAREWDVGFTGIKVIRCPVFDDLPITPYNLLSTGLFDWQDCCQPFCENKIYRENGKLISYDAALETVSAVVSESGSVYCSAECLAGTLRRKAS